MCGGIAVREVNGVGVTRFTHAHAHAYTHTHTHTHIHTHARTRAEILSHIKKDQALKDSCTSVPKIRRTKAGSLLIVPTKQSSGKATDLHKAMQTSLGEFQRQLQGPRA